MINNLDDLAILTAPVRTPSFGGGAMITSPSKRLRNLSTLVLRNNPIYSLGFSGKPSHRDSHLLDINDNGHNGHKQEQPTTSTEGGVTMVEASMESPYTTNSYHGSGYSSTGSYHVLSPVKNVFLTDAFPNLYELSLSFCQLSGELEPFPALPLTNLEISMGLKSATRLSHAMFQQLRNLEWLALDHNNLQSVNDYSFYSNRNLTYVNLAWNKIQVLPRQLFHPDIHQAISQVRFSHNKIQTVQSESFLSFPASNLDLSYNEIQTGMNFIMFY